MENQSVRIVIFKSLAILNIVHLDLIRAALICTVEQLNIIWQGKKPITKHSNLCNTCKNGGLKDVNIFG